MQTSYAFISIYKQRITSLDRALQSAPRHQPRQGGHGPVEYRKLMQRFRQFLAEEEKFWTQLVVRLRRSFGLDEAQSAFVALGILPPDEPTGTHARESPEQSHQREGPTSNGRNQFQFPPEDSTPPALPQSSTERTGRLTILSKALVCLGDIARYRELYNESGGRPKAGHEEALVPARKNARNKRGGAPGMDIPRARNYDKAQQCYEQARLLVPDEGNPSHQLAILSSYQKDLFGSLIHYYRALCVLQPYDTASENLGTVLNKALDQWKARMRREKEKNGGKLVERDGASTLAPRLRVEAFKEKVVVLHALWRLGVDRCIFLLMELAKRLLTFWYAQNGVNIPKACRRCSQRFRFPCI
jgi:protein SMG7